MLITDVKIEYVIEYTLIYFLAFFGSFAQDYLKILKDGKGSPALVKIFFSAITSSLLVFMLSASIQERFGGVRGLMFCSFLAGLSGFKLLEKLASGDVFDTLYKMVKDYISFLMKRK